MVEVQLAAVRVDVQSNTPVVLLQETQGARRTLPIFIGTPEATAIALAIQGVTTTRPMTHDLMRDVLSELGVTLERVVITELRQTTYYAELTLTQGNSHKVVSSRPSDAIALAARMGATLYVADDLLDAEGVVLPTEEESSGNPEEVIAEFQDFLKDVKPEDFSAPE
jgi:bifunctional DNase/RNase